MLVAVAMILGVLVGVPGSASAAEPNGWTR
jgi:hypothetical protein